MVILGHELSYRDMVVAFFRNLDSDSCIYFRAYQGLNKPWSERNPKEEMAICGSCSIYHHNTMAVDAFYPQRKSNSGNHLKSVKMCERAARNTTALYNDI